MGQIDPWVVLHFQEGYNVFQGGESDARGIVQFANDLETAAAPEQEM